MAKAEVEVIEAAAMSSPPFDVTIEMSVMCEINLPTSLLSEKAFKKAVASAEAVGVEEAVSCTIKVEVPRSRELEMTTKRPISTPNKVAASLISGATSSVLISISKLMRSLMVSLDGSFVDGFAVVGATVALSDPVPEDAADEVV